MGWNDWKGRVNRADPSLDQSVAMIPDGHEPVNLAFGKGASRRLPSATSRRRRSNPKAREISS
jgi:hypothetical protein